MELSRWARLAENFSSRLSRPIAPTPLNRNGPDRLSAEKLPEIWSDGDVLEDHVPRRCPAARRGPVALAVPVELEADQRLVEDDFARVDCPAEQRRQRQHHGEILDLGEGALEIAPFIGDTDASQADFGNREDGEADIAIDTHGPADHFRSLRLEHIAILVPVENIGGRQCYGQHCHNNRGQGSEKRTHQSLQVMPAEASRPPLDQ
jgi:hypothetical protein